MKVVSVAVLNDADPKELQDWLTSNATVTVNFVTNVGLMFFIFYTEAA